MNLVSKRLEELSSASKIPLAIVIVQLANIPETKMYNSNKHLEAPEYEKMEQMKEIYVI